MRLSFEIIRLYLVALSSLGPLSKSSLRMTHLTKPKAVTLVITSPLSTLRRVLAASHTMALRQ